MTGAEHRVRIDMPDGFEYRLAEVGRGWTKTRGPIGSSWPTAMAISASSISPKAASSAEHDRGLEAALRRDRSIVAGVLCSPPWPGLTVPAGRRDGHAGMDMSGFG